MNKFSIEIMPFVIKLYKCSREEFKNIILKYNIFDIDDILCQTFLQDEITLYYKYNSESIDNSTNNMIFSKICTSDNRLYTVINIYEDIPGIDHVGIIYKISKLFLEKNIPILYVNTYGHNLILVSEEHIKNAIDTLKIIGNID